MSWQACANAKSITSFRDGSSLSPTDKCVLMLLADYCNPDTGNAYPRIATLAKFACMEERSLNRVLAKLKAGGVIEIIPQKDARGSCLPNFYRIPFLSGYPDPQVTLPPDPQVTPTTTSKEPQEIPLTLFEGDAPPRKDLKKEVGQIVEGKLFPYYIEIVKEGSTTYTLTPARLKKAIARFLECLRKSDNDMGKASYLMETAIYALSESDWHMGRQKGQPKKYNDWNDHLFTSAERLEKWLEQ